MHERVSFLTSHARTLLSIHGDPEVRMRDLAVEIGLTERRTQEIVSELVVNGYLSRERVGRRNHYRIEPDSSPVQQFGEIDALELAFPAPGN